MGVSTHKFGGEDWIRTSVGVSQQIYSLPPLATRAPLRRTCNYNHISELFQETLKNICEILVFSVLWHCDLHCNFVFYPSKGKRALICLFGHLLSQRLVLASRGGIQCGDSPSTDRTHSLRQDPSDASFSVARFSQKKPPLKPSFRAPHPTAWRHHHRVDVLHRDPGPHQRAGRAWFQHFSAAPPGESSGG